MRTITIEKNIYNFSELNEIAKLNAMSKYNNPVSCNEEWEATLNAFCYMFDIKMRDWSVGDYDYYFDVKSYGSINCGGYRLSKYLNNNDNYKYKYDNKYHTIDFMADNCGLTGFCGDYTVLLPIVETKNYKRKYDTHEDMFNDCLKSLFSEWRDDRCYQASEEYFAELADINEWEFDENGNII